MDELVTIILPTYRRPGMLGRAIKSCLDQTYNNIEILVIDDNDPNTSERKETEEFMKKYELVDKIKYIKRESNGGGCASRNTGIENANGEYIAFLDDDDYFIESKIEKQLKAMKNAKLDASFTGSEVFDETKNRIVRVQTHPNFEKYDNVLKYHIVEMIVSTQTFMFKTKVLREIGGFDNVPAGQEYVLMHKVILNNYNVGCIHDVLVRICIHSGERITTSKNKIEAEKYLYNLKKKHFDILTFSDKRKVKYTYKRNIYQKLKSSGSLKRYPYLIYIVFTHFLLLFKKKVVS